MMIKPDISLMCVFMIVVTLLLWQGYAAAETQDDIRALSAKIDDVLATQKTITADLASIKEELNVIKIRVTQNQ